MMDQVLTLLLYALGWTGLFEGITVFVRYRFQMRMVDHAGSLGRYTFGIRIHHGFVGLLLLAGAAWIQDPTWQLHTSALLIGLVLSDILHHFIVLLQIEGDHEFHLRSDGKLPTNLREQLEAFSSFGIIAYGFFWALIVEALTVFFRFGLEMQSQQETAFLKQVTFGLRIHHGYIGLVLLVIAMVCQKPWMCRLMIVAGIALTVSDLVHHFLVLWPITGHHDFFLTY